MEDKQPNELEQRKSGRINKGIPPRRFLESISCDPRIPSLQSLPENVPTNASRAFVESDIVSVVGHRKDDAIHRSSHQRRSSIASKESVVSQLNLELEMLKKQRELAEEENQERMRAINEKQDFLRKEMDLQRQLIEVKSCNNSQSVISQSLYGDPQHLKEWINDARECIVSVSPKCSQEQRHEPSLADIQRVPLEEEKETDKNILLNIAKQCIDNSAVTNKLLLRQKIRDLTYFSGEFTEWPIFINEYQRTTESYNLSDEENLIRLDRSLRGKARDTVRALLTSPRNVPKIISMLEMNFGRSEWIIISLIDKVKRMPIIREDRLEFSIHFSNAINNMVTTMKNVDGELYLFNVHKNKGMNQEEIHKVVDCEEFLKKSIEERRAAVLEHKMCFMCLKVGHTANRCYHQKSRCGQNGCRGMHNKFLHIEKSIESTEKSESPKDFCANVSTKTDKMVLLRIAPVILRGPAGKVTIHALFDEGSTCSMIEESLAEMLALSGPTSPLCFQWTNGVTHHEEESKMVSLRISAGNLNAPVEYRMNNIRTVKELSLPSQCFDENEMMKRFPYLDYNVLKSVSSTQPQLLIGQDNCDLIIPREIIQARFNQPVMSKSKLGWTIHGVCDSPVEMVNLHVSLCCQNVLDQELHKIVKDSFSLESFGVNHGPNTGIKSIEDKKAIGILEKTVQEVEGHYEVGHLWKNEEETLPDSRKNAISRLLCMERKMSRDKEFEKEYCDKITDYVMKGYARKLESIEVTESPKTWYLPHFAVWNINKPGKIRLVFDAAAKSFGNSLNDFLLQGPDLVPSLISVLWRFRQARVAFTGDIKEMFHQVVIRKEDRCAQRFLWRGTDRSRAPDVYEMNVMIFGAVSSPSVAQFIKNLNGEKFEEQFPGICRIMKKQHYVDDYLDSCNDIEEAVETVKNVIYVHKQAGFEMTKWISNSDTVMNSIPEHLRAPADIAMKINYESIERVLGLSWLPLKDCFVFSLNLKKIPEEISTGARIPTKREVLRMIMSIFDPLGFLVPLMVKARILMQDIWRNNIDWDNEINDVLFSSWKKWLNELQQAAPITIPRYYFPGFSRVKEVDLHVFADASDKAYAAVAFFCLEGKEKTYIHISFVSAKFKVAPLNQQTVPKLELQAAVLACRMAKTITSEIEYCIRQVHYWTDSMVVLHQIRSQSRRFPIFVSCRIGEILEETDCSQWHWVPSELNVADQATKETKFLDLSSDSSWFNGPEFLKQGRHFWPMEPQNKQIGIEKETVLLHNDIQFMTFLPEISRFSKWTRLVRSTAWIIFAVKQFCLPKLERSHTLTLGVEEIEKASKLWIIKSQWESFKLEIQDLHEKKDISRASRLLKLSVFLDSDGILRIGGRLPDIDIDYDSKFPIILSPDNRYTKLLIDHHHVKAGHVGIETVVNNLRMKYWILHIRAAVKKSFRACQSCRIRKCMPIAPEMGCLPRERVESFVFPFTFVGIDFFGPINVSIGRRVEKRYGVIFTCLTIRAVHIELASSLDTSSTIMAIRRFMCRRGQPKEIFTDNGTNFVGAEREIRELIQSLDNQGIADNLSIDGIIWKFNPPGAAHMGGIWERMIRSVKTALKITLKSMNPKEEVLMTLMLEVEYMINSRPLTHISIDPSEPEAITPNHFILLRSGQVKSYGDIENETHLTRKRWRLVESLANSYWKRWIKEYRPQLIQRQKWHKKIDPIKIGDITIIMDEKLPRNEWLLGRVQETYPGKDGTPRVAQIKTRKGIYTRPVTKICILPTSAS